MIIAKIQCICGNWVRIRTMADYGTKNCWVCNRKIEVERRGGHGARITAKSGGKPPKKLFVEYEE